MWEKRTEGACMTRREQCGPVEVNSFKITKEYKEKQEILKGMI